MKFLLALISDGVDLLVELLGFALCLVGGYFIYVSWEDRNPGEANIFDWSLATYALVQDVYHLVAGIGLILLGLFIYKSSSRSEPASVKALKDEEKV